MSAIFSTITLYRWNPRTIKSWRFLSSGKEEWGNTKSHALNHLHVQKWVISAKTSQTYTLQKKDDSPTININMRHKIVLDPTPTHPHPHKVLVKITQTLMKYIPSHKILKFLKSCKLTQKCAWECVWFYKHFIKCWWI